MGKNPKKTIVFSLIAAYGEEYFREKYLYVNNVTSQKT